MSDPRPLGYIPSPPDERDWSIGALLATVPYAVVPPEYEVPNLWAKALDQDGVGACVAFSGSHQSSWMQHNDVGAWLWDDTAAMTAYKWLKQGHGAWPGDGIPNVEGSYPRAFWEMARVEGVPAVDGKAYKISGYYRIPLNSADDADTLQRTIMAFGPVNVGTPWPSNWFTSPTPAKDYVLVDGGGRSGAHAYVIVGWKTIGGVLYWTCRNSWGYWGSAAGTFRYRADYLWGNQFGPNEAWKTVDYDDPPTPVDGGIVKAYDRTPRMLNIPAGTQLYRQDGTTPLTKLVNPGVVLYSPCAWDTANLNVVVTTGGVQQQAVVRKAACSAVLAYGDNVVTLQVNGTTEYTRTL